MNRGLIFDSPFLLGFEHTRILIERAAKAAAETYPPYNVEDRGDGGLRNLDLARDRLGDLPAQRVVGFAHRVERLLEPRHVPAQAQVLVGQVRGLDGAHACPHVMPDTIRLTVFCRIP